VPACERIVLVGLAGHHNGAVLVPQGVNEAEHLPPPVGVAVKEVLKERDRIDHDPLGTDLLHENRELVLDAVDGEIEI